MARILPAVQARLSSRRPTAPALRAGSLGAGRHGVSSVLALIVLALGVTVMGSFPALAGESIRIDAFDRTLPVNEHPKGWKSSKISPFFGSGDSYYFRFVDDGKGEHYIHLRSGDDNSFTLGLEREFDLTKHTILEWEWRITRLPKGGDVRVEDRDDQAGSMCVIVDPGLTGFESVCYLWENDGPIGTPLTSTKRDDSKYIILRTGTGPPFGEWVRERRNILADFRTLFGKDPDDPAIIGMQIDSDSTESSAEAFYRNIYLRTK